MKGPFALAMTGILFSASALAARWATVDGDNVELKKGPGDKYDVIGHLSKGTRIHASNYPTQGYFKVRTPTGQIGWVIGTTLILGDLPRARERNELMPDNNGDEGTEPPPPAGGDDGLPPPPPKSPD